MTKLYLFIFLFAFIMIGVNDNLIAQLRGEVETEVQDNRFKLAQSYIRNGNYTAAEELLLEVFKKEKSSSVVIELINVFEAQKKYKQAIELIENLAKNDPKGIANNYQFQAVLGKLYWLGGSTAKSDEIWNKTIEDNQKNPYAYEFLSDLQLSMQLFEKSISTLKKSRTNMNLPNMFGNKIIKIYISTNNYEDGYNEIIRLFDYNRTNQNNKNNYEIYDEDGNIFYMEQTPNQNMNKKQTLEQYIQENNSMFDLNAVKGRLSSFNQTKECKEYFQKNLQNLSDKFEGNIYIQDLYAWYLKSINSKEVYDVYVRLDKIRNTQGRTVLGLGDESRIDGNYELSLKCYDYVMNLGTKSPNYQNAFYNSILTKEIIAQKKIYQVITESQDQNLIKETKSKNYNQIIDMYKDFLKDYPNSNFSLEARLKIANLYKLSENYETAQTEYEAIIKQYGKSTGIGKAYLELSDLFLYKNDLQGAELQLDFLLKSGRVDAETTDLAKMKKADILMYKGDLTRADSLYQFLSHSTDKNISNDAIENNFIIQKNEDFTTDVIKFFKAELYLKQQKIKEAIDLYLEINKDDVEKDIAELALIEIAKIYTKQNKYEEAISYLQKVEKRNIYSTNNDFALLLIAKNQMNLKQNETAIETLKTILNRYPYTIYLQEVRDMIKTLRESI